LGENSKLFIEPPDLSVFLAPMVSFYSSEGQCRCSYELPPSSLTRIPRTDRLAKIRSATLRARTQTSRCSELISVTVSQVHFPATQSSVWTCDRSWRYQWRGIVAKQNDHNSCKRFDSTKAVRHALDYSANDTRAVAWQPSRTRIPSTAFAVEATDNN
jgi:hypothetical protein